MADQYLVKWHTGSETGAEEVEIARTARGEEDARRDGGNESRQKEEGESQRKGKKKPTARVELAAFRSLIVKV